MEVIIILQPIKDFEDYLIDEEGNVFSKKTNKFLKHGTSGRKYHSVSLMKDGKRKVKYIHRLVAETFIPNPYNLPTVNHIDGNKDNNTVTNLEWLSYSANNQHAYDTEIKARGESFYNAKLTEDAVREIRKLKDVMNLNQLSKKYGVSRATISDVINNKTWKHII